MALQLQTPRAERLRTVTMPSAATAVDSSATELFVRTMTEWDGKNGSEKQKARALTRCAVCGCRHVLTHQLSHGTD